MAESGDLNASLASTDVNSILYHYTADSKLVSMPVWGVASNAELVMTEKGQYKGYIFAYTLATETTTNPDNSIEIWLWDGSNGYMTGEYPKHVDIIGIGVEIEKPFLTSKGFYFSMEQKNEAIKDEKDAIFFWDGSTSPHLVWSSDNELEVENPPLDGQGGFYFVNVDLTSPDANTLISTMSLMHARTTGSTFVCDLGSFLAPPSTFFKDPKDPQAVPAEKFQNEYALVEVPEQNQLFVGAGPVGGKFRLTVLDWTKKAALESGDNIIITFNDEDMGGNANIGGMLKFEERGRSSSSSGCDSGLGILCIMGLSCFIISKRGF